MGHRVTTLNVNTIEPAGNTLTIGASGDSVVIGNNDIRANTYKDAGGNTLFVSDGSGNLSSVNAGFGDPLKLLSTQTFTNQATVAFTSGITSTYKEYIFYFINMNPATTGAMLQFQVDDDAGNNAYNDFNITSTYFRAKQFENNSGSTHGYETGSDNAAVSYATISSSLFNAADASTTGIFHLYNPSSAVYVKNWQSRFSAMCYDGSNLEYVQSLNAAGYVNTTTALNAISFKMTSGNFDGTIKMYGVA